MDLNLFDTLSSDSDSERDQARKAFEEFFEDPNFDNVLFELLSTPDLNQNYYILASKCLLIWFKNNFRQKNEEEKDIFVQKLQSFLLINHPAQKEIYKLYISTIYVHSSSVYVKYLGDSVHLISVDTPPDELVCVLKLSFVTSMHFINTLNSEIHQYAVELFTEINNRLLPILLNTQEYLTDPIGCAIIRYSFKTILHSTKKCQFNSDLIPLIRDIFYLILENISNIENREFYLLVRFCHKMLTNIFNFSSSNMIVRSFNFRELGSDYDEIIPEVALRFTFALAPYHVDAINSFIESLYYYALMIPETPEVVEVFHEIATLTEVDLSDFVENPNIFYEYAYSSLFLSNSRKLCFDFIDNKCEQKRGNDFLCILISYPPTEAMMYLISATIKAATKYSLGSEVFEWIVECVNQQIHFQSPIEMSTFLYLVSRATLRIIAPEHQEFLQALAPLVFEIVTTSVSESNEVYKNEEFPNDEEAFLCSDEFIIECSKCIATVTNAIRVARKIMRSGSIEFPPEMLLSVIQLIPDIPTSDAIRFIKCFIEESEIESEKNEFLLSQSELIKYNICDVAIAAIASTVELEESSERSAFNKNKEADDYKIISSSLNTLDDIISREGEEPSITDEMLELIEKAITNYSQYYSEEINKLIISLFTIRFPAVPQIVGLLAETICANNRLLAFVNHFYITFIFFILLFHDTFIEMEISPYIASIGIEFILRNANCSSNSDSLIAGMDLICFSIQTDPNLDVTPFLEYVDEQIQSNGGFVNYLCIMILMSILVTRPQLIQDHNFLLHSIIEWAGEENAKCPYEKRLAALSLLILTNSDDIMKMAIELLSQEKEQKEMLAQGAKPTCHCHPSPIDQFDLTEIAQNAVSKCSPENQKAFMDSILLYN